MVNDLTLTRSQTTTTLSPRKQVTPQDAALVEALVKVRQVQGWNLQQPKDAKLMGTVWKEQLDRYEIHPGLYGKLVDLAVDYRIKEIGHGKQPTPLTVELMISCYQQYRILKLEELNQINQQIEYYRSLRHRYQSEQISLESAAQQARFHEGIEHEEFVAKADELINKLEQQSESFMEESLLDV